MSRRSCPSCARRLPYAGRRCVHCGWSLKSAADEAGTAPRRRRGRVVSTVLVLLGLGMVGLAWRNAAVLADWYAAFALRHLPAGASSLAPAGTDRGAFFFCARQVSRRMDGEFSVETFPSERESRLEQLGEDRFRVESWVDETREDGRRVRFDFSCTVRFARGRWVLESLTVRDLAAAGGADRGLARSGAR